MAIIRNSAIIVAVTKDNIIGINNQLPFYIPEDLRYFKRMTIGNIVVMGKNTFLSMNEKLLPHRANIVLSSTLEFGENVVVKDIMTVMSRIKSKRKYDSNFKKPQRTVFFIGGVGVYDYFLDKVEHLYVTYVDVSVQELMDVKNNMGGLTPKSIVINPATREQYKVYLETKNIDVNSAQLTYFPKVHLWDIYQLDAIGFKKKSETPQEDFSSIYNYRFVKYSRAK